MSEVSTANPRFDLSGFAVAPELASDAHAKISALQDVVGQMVREAKVLGRTVPLGGGYADEVGRFMAQYGIGAEGSAVEALTAFGKELEALKTRIAKALAKYTHQDEEAAAGVDCVGG
ncbi:hypothetical protein [Amycolatopsis sp. NPDC051071]|uniref:hypothetical protein n=1 Tax=Amycolatopsis sp. NPDC051071 TaxID=3154637 RepID=UPI00342DF2A9